MGREGISGTSTFDLESGYAQRLSSTIEQNKKRREEALERTYKAWAKFHKISVKEFKRRLQKVAEQRVQESDFFVQVSTKALVDIFEGSGRFKNQHETGAASTGRRHYPGAKKSAELSMFGIPIDAEPETRPVYGFLSNDPNGEVQSGINYGDITVKFKRKAVLSKTTVTFGDSWNNWGDGGRNMIVPTAATEPHFTSIYVGAHLDEIPKDRLEDAKEQDPLKLPESSQVLSHRQGGRDYYEAQYHGTITSDYIESIHISQKTLDENGQLRDLVERIKGRVKVVIT